MCRRRCEEADKERASDRADAGFTLFEVLVVMAVLMIAMTAVSALYRSPSAGLLLKSAAASLSSRLRDVRAAAMATGSERVANIDVNERRVSFGDGREPLELDRALTLSVTAADSERRTAAVAGIRFFPNGSSSGATILLQSERLKYEVRVNWLTGRVSTAEIQ